MKTGLANLPLHYGHAPRWLFNRMVKLGRAISEIIINDYGRTDFLRRLSDPFFFQSYANVLGWDFHSSGATPVLCAALKEANLNDLGIIVTGGKGNTSRETPKEIEKYGNAFGLSTKRIERLKYTSKIIAKVDNSLIQDGYQLYTHSLIFTEDAKKYTVIQQGMNSENRYARRYHWISDKVKDFVNEPQNAICCDENKKEVLNMTAKESDDVRRISVDLVKDNFFSRQKTLHEFERPIKVLTMKAQHQVYLKDLHKSSVESLKRAYEVQPKNYEELVSLKGIGPKTIRALALVSELVHGKKASWKDPAKYSFTVGGKDGYPYPINRAHYDGVIDILDNSIRQAKLGDKDRAYAIKRLKDFI